MLSRHAGGPFDEIARLQTQLATRQFAAFFMEPIQSEGGIRVPSPEYMQAAQRLASDTEHLLVLDEVQTGMYRTGTFLAGHHFDVEPDIVILAKALSGGVIPCRRRVDVEAIYDSVYCSVKRAIVHTSTFSENGLAMRAGLATLKVLHDENLGERTADLANIYAQRLPTLSRHDMVERVVGTGLLCGIVFEAPRN